MLQKTAPAKKAPKAQIAKTKASKTAVRSKPRRITMATTDPRTALRVLSGDFAAAKKLGSMPSPDAVEAWFVTAKHNLQRFAGADAPQVVVFDQAVSNPLEKLRSGKFQSGDLALAKGVAHACAILEHYLRSLRDEAGVTARA